MGDRTFEVGEKGTQSCSRRLKKPVQFGYGERKYEVLCQWIQEMGRKHLDNKDEDLSRNKGSSETERNCYSFCI